MRDRRRSLFDRYRRRRPDGRPRQIPIRLRLCLRRGLLLCQRAVGCFFAVDEYLGSHAVFRIDRYRAVKAAVSRCGGPLLRCRSALVLSLRAALRGNSTALDGLAVRAEHAEEFLRIRFGSGYRNDLRARVVYDRDAAFIPDVGIPVVMRFFVSHYGAAQKVFRAYPRYKRLCFVSRTRRYIIS